MSKSAKSAENLQRTQAFLQQQIHQADQRTFSQMNASPAAADRMVLNSALATVDSAQIGTAHSDEGSSSGADTVAGQSVAPALSSFSAVRAQAPSLLPTEDNVQPVHFRKKRKK